jgi:predicted PurR-regulated permease PerM
MQSTRLFALAAAMALAVGCFLVVKPFISSLLWAAILVFCTWPIFLMLTERLRLSRTIAAIVMVLVSFLVLVVPVIYVAPTSRAEIDALQGSIERLLAGGLPDITPALGLIPFVGDNAVEWWRNIAGDSGALMAVIRPYAGTIAQTALTFLLSILSGVAELLAAILLAFFFYRDGPAIATRIEAMMERLAGGPRAHRLVTLTGNVTRGVVFGLVGTAIAQGAMTFVGLYVAGVPQAALLGVVTGVVSVLPIGAPLIWFPAALWLFSQGSVGWGVFMLLYGGLGISSVDNIIRPWFISKGADLPLLLTLLGALGGVFAFGFLGLFLGPVLLAVGYSVIKDWADHGTAGGAPAEPVE